MQLAPSLECGLNLLSSFLYAYLTATEMIDRALQRVRQRPCARQVGNVPALSACVFLGATLRHGREGVISLDIVQWCKEMLFAGGYL